MARNFSSNFLVFASPAVASKIFAASHSCCTRRSMSNNASRRTDGLGSLEAAAGAGAAEEEEEDAAAVVGAGAAMVWGKLQTKATDEQRKAGQSAVLAASAADCSALGSGGGRTVVVARERSAERCATNLSAATRCEPACRVSCAQKGKSGLSSAFLSVANEL